MEAIVVVAGLEVAVEVAGVRSGFVRVGRIVGGKVDYFGAEAVLG